jgi:Flp pilus assembly pilin Flp
MLTILNLMLRSLRSERGVVSVEWLILGAVVMAAIVGAFSPTFTDMLSGAVTEIGTVLTAQMNAAAS